MRRSVRVLVAAALVALTNGRSLDAALAETPKAA